MSQPSRHALWRYRNPEARMIQDARKRAMRLGVPFTLKKEDIVIPAQCPVLGIELVQQFGQASDASPSLDRIVAEKGYTKENTIVISMRANRIRNDGSHWEHLRVSRFYRALRRKRK